MKVQFIQMIRCSYFEVTFKSLTHLYQHPINSYGILCMHLAPVQSKKTPEIAQTQEMMSRFIFGRFWGPAIACPQAYGICEGRLPPTVNRGLVLASKVLQVRQ